MDYCCIGQEIDLFDNKIVRIKNIYENEDYMEVLKQVDNEIDELKCFMKSKGVVLNIIEESDYDEDSEEGNLDLLFAKKYKTNNPHFEFYFVISVVNRYKM